MEIYGVPLFFTAREKRVGLYVKEREKDRGRLIQRRAKDKKRYRSGYEKWRFVALDFIREIKEIQVAPFVRVLVSLDRNFERDRQTARVH